MLWHIRIEPAPSHSGPARRTARCRGRRVRARRPLVGRDQPRLPDRGRALRGRSSSAPRATCWSIRSSRSTRSARAMRRSTGPGRVVHVLPKPGVTDPEGRAPSRSLRDLGYPVSNVRTIRTYRVDGPAESLPRLIQRVLANDAVEQAVRGTLAARSARAGQPYRFRRVAVPIRDSNDAALLHLSRSGQLALQPRRDESDPAPLRRARPRPDRLRARDAGPDLERALLAQDAARPDRVSRARRSTTCSSRRSSRRPTTWAATGS